jgi:hypothetical protein
LQHQKDVSTSREILPRASLEASLSLSFDPTALIAELGFSLTHPDRELFCTAAADALARLTPLGEGVAYRTLVPVQRAHWQPPPDLPGCGPKPLGARKLERQAEAQPLATGRDRRRTQSGAA